MRVATSKSFLGWALIMGSICVLTCSGVLPSCIIFTTATFICWIITAVGFVGIDQEKLKGGNQCFDVLILRIDS